MDAVKFHIGTNRLEIAKFVCYDNIYTYKSKLGNIHYQKSLSKYKRWFKLKSSIAQENTHFQKIVNKISSTDVLWSESNWK